MKVKFPKEQTDLFNQKYPNYNYHLIWAMLGSIGGIVGTFYCCIIWHGVSEGIGLAFLILTFGTLFFAVVPMCFVAITILIKYLPALSFPIYIILLIGKMSGETNLIDEYGYTELLLLSIGFSAFGLFNIITARRAAFELGESSSDNIVVFPFGKD